MRIHELTKNRPSHKQNIKYNMLDASISCNYSLFSVPMPPSWDKEMFSEKPPLKSTQIQFRIHCLCSLYLTNHKLLRLPTERSKLFVCECWKLDFIRWLYTCYKWCELNEINSIKIFFKKNSKRKHVWCTPAQNQRLHLTC